MSSALTDTIINAKTRAKVAALSSLLPPVTASSEPHLVNDLPSGSENPYTIPMRPCESAVRKAQALFDKERKNGRNVSSVKMPQIGKFTEEDLVVLRQFCSVSDIYYKV